MNKHEQQKASTRLLPFLLIGILFWQCSAVETGKNEKAPVPTPLPPVDTEVRQKVMNDFMFGAVYFRKVNPPREDWERDYRVAAEDGHNIFRHWLLWSAIETSPGVYDFSDYDRHLDLAAENGIHTIIAEMTTCAPEWAFEKYPEARLENRDGTKDYSIVNQASMVGGFPGLSLNDERVKIAIGNFLRATAERYKDHPGMSGYDLVNEAKFPQTPNGRQDDYSFDPATQEVFRTWLKRKYGTLDSLKNAWHRWSYIDWSQVQAPRQIAPLAEVQDWLEFRVDNFHEQIKWRADVIRSVDPNHPITAHGKAYTLSHMARSCNDAWKAAEIVDLQGFTWGAHKHGTDPWLQFHAVDLMRSACKGKPFWHAEMIGGPHWVSERERHDGKVATPEDLRLWAMVSLAGGAQGLLNPRWRPLLNGHLYGAYGFYGMDGSRTSRSAMASKIAKWGAAQAQKPLWEADPVQGEIGIVVVPETQLWDYSMYQHSKNYSQAVFGVYQGFFDNNIQADWVRIDDIDQYDLLYLPYPVMLKKASAEKLIRWVEKGGKLISEGCPGYLGDHAWVGEVQPNNGLDKLFGVKESYVEFGYNLHEDWTIHYAGKSVPVGLNHQEYELAGATAKGTYQNGTIAVAENDFGQGKTLLLGSFPGYGYSHTPTPESKEFFRKLLQWAGKIQMVKCEEEGVIARLHQHQDGRRFLWVVNHNDNDATVKIELDASLGSLAAGHIYWGIDPSPQVNGQNLDLRVQGHDVAVLQLIENASL